MGAHPPCLPTRRLAVDKGVAKGTAGMGRISCIVGTHPAVSAAAWRVTRPSSVQRHFDGVTQTATVLGWAYVPAVRAGGGCVNGGSGAAGGACGAPACERRAAIPGHTARVHVRPQGCIWDANSCTDGAVFHNRIRARSRSSAGHRRLLYLSRTSGHSRTAIGDRGRRFHPRERIGGRWRPLGPTFAVRGTRERVGGPHRLRHGHPRHHFCSD